MKTQQKKQASKNTFRGRFVRTSLHLLRLVGFSLGVLTLLLLFHLMVIGLPQPATRWALQHLQNKGIPIRAEKITLAPHRGWVLHNVQLYSPNPDDLTPMLQVDRLYFGFWVDRWGAPKLENIDFYISAKDARVSLGTTWEETLPQNFPFRKMDHLKAVLRILPDRLVIETLHANWGLLTIHSSGTIGFSTAVSPTNNTWITDVQETLPTFFQILNTPTYSTPIRVDIELSVLPDQPQNHRSVVSLSVEDFLLNAGSYNGLEGRLVLQKDSLLLDEIHLVKNANEWIYIDGSLDFESGQIEARLKNRFLSASLLSLFPESASNLLENAGCSFPGSFDFDLTLGPALPKNLFDNFQASIHDLALNYHNLQLNPLQFELHREGKTIDISKINGSMHGGVVQGSVRIDLSEQAWAASLQGKADPRPIGRFVGGDTQEWLSRFSFQNQLPDFSLTMSDTPENNSFRLDLTASGKDLFFADHPFDSARMGLSYSNRLLEISSLYMTQQDHSLEADVVLHLSNQTAWVDGSTDMPLPDIAHMIAPSHPTVLDHFSFPSNSFGTLHGTVDYTGNDQHDFSGYLRADVVEAAGLDGKNFSTTFKASGAQLTLTNTFFQLYGGSVESASSFEINFQTPQAPYVMNLDATQVDFQQLLSAVFSKDVARSSGRLSGTFDFRSDAAGPFWANTQGSGEVEIAGGTLQDLPLLGGFSRIIRTTLPGFSIFSFTTLYSEYELRDGSVKTDNLQLGGSLLSARAQGSYSPAKGLNFNVKTEPLRQVRQKKDWYMVHLWLADALKQGTAPLFRLLELRLDGSLDKPNWSLRALP